MNYPQSDSFQPLRSAGEKHQEANVGGGVTDKLENLKKKKLVFTGFLHKAVKHF